MGSLAPEKPCKFSLLIFLSFTQLWAETKCFSGSSRKSIDHSARKVRSTESVDRGFPGAVPDKTEQPWRYAYTNWYNKP